MVDQKRGPPYAYKDFLPFTSESTQYNPGPRHMVDKKTLLEILPLNIVKLPQAMYSSNLVYDDYHRGLLLPRLVD